MIKNKKGELTTQQIVILVITILSFVVVLFLLFQLNLGETSDKQICYNSVVLKSKGELVGGALDCRTNKICISGGGDCVDESYTKVKVDVGSANAKENVMKVIADEMADCWWMFGEGKLNYVGADLGGKTSCALCSSILFDDKILEQDFNINYQEFYEYLSKANKSETQTYLNYLYKSYDVEQFQNEVSYLNIDLDNDLILGNGKFNVFTGVKKGALGGVGGLFQDTFFYSYYVSANDMSKFKYSCGEYVTKAD